jgi:basic membrane lipoprotein Med (substrate-binding protein (PBP1-ABC) superfamily)
MNEEYYKAKKLGDRELRRARSEGKDPHVASLDVILPEADTLAHDPIGVQEIPLRMIAGTKTVARANAFARNFMPIMKDRTEMAEKWANLYDAQIEEGIRDPIQVYEYMLHFYVQEGNKRVSVLKYLGVPSIEADITRILPKESDDPDYLMYQEFLEFYHCVPIYDIVFTVPGSYRRFAAMVNQDLKHKWDRDFINVVRGAFFRFYSVFLRKGGNDLPITPGDAFLLYLQVYRFDSLLDRSRYDIEERLNEVWKEVLLKTQDKKVSLLKEPIEEKRSLLMGALFNENHPLKALFIYGRDPQEDVWELSHENARKGVTEAFHGKVKTSWEIAAEGKENTVRINDDVKDYDVVFTTRRELMNDTLRAALKYPNIRFFNCSIFLNYQAVTGYFGRMYEAMFLMGRIAAGAAKNHKIGYVANAPVLGRLSEINAFAIGAALVDPEAKIYLEWSGKKEGCWLDDFKKEGIEIYAGPDMADVADNQPVHGVRRITDHGADVLAVPIWNWELYYEKILGMVLDRQWDRAKSENGNTAMNCWWGMDTGVIDVHLDPSLDWVVKKDITIWKRLLMNNAWNPFEGQLRSQDKEIQPDTTERLSSDEIISMDWLNHNIIGTIPVLSELNEDMRQLTMVSGVKGTENV